MPVNDWNNLGRDVKDIVQHAINSGDFSALNRDLGATLDSALGNVAQSMKRAGNAYSNKYSYKPFGGYRNPSQRERMKEAREEFALFVNTNGAKALGLLFTTLGIALTIMFGVTAGILGILSLFIGSIASKIGTVMMIFLPAMGLSAIMGICGNRLRKKIKRFRSYVKTLNGKPYANVKDLAKSVRKSEKFVRKDLKKMIDKRMFLEGHLDKNGVCFMATDDAYEQYLETERNMEERKAEEARRPKTQLSEDVQKVIEEGNRYIEEIRRSNDAIPGVEISNKMYHLENVIRRIFQRVEKHPELINDLHKFMDYYLPTTMKLLNAYEELPLTLLLKICWTAFIKKPHGMYHRIYLF